MPEYGTRKYWDERYAEDEAGFDWLFDYGSVRRNLRLLVRPEDRVLVVGCGNAEFSAQLHADGFRNAVHVDSSEVVIRQMRQRHADMDFRVMDVLALGFRDETVDVVLDKSLIDTLLCYDQSVQRVSEMMWEIHRVLKPGGRYVSMSLHHAREMLGYFSPDYPLPSEKACGPPPRSPPSDWCVQWCRVRNPRWNSDEGSERSVAHTFVVCTKTPKDRFAPLAFLDFLPEEEEKQLALQAAKAESEGEPEWWQDIPTDEFLRHLDTALEASLQRVQAHASSLMLRRDLRA